MKLALAMGIALVVAFAGCSSGPAIPSGPVDVHIVHRYSNTTADTFGIPEGAGTLHVVVLLENFYRNRCPAPTAQLVLQAPDGSAHVRLETQNLPTQDCVYAYEKNETLMPGWWIVHYAGGSENLGSIVDVRPAS